MKNLCQRLRSMVERKISFLIFFYSIITETISFSIGCFLVNGSQKYPPARVGFLDPLVWLEQISCVSAAASRLFRRRKPHIVRFAVLQMKSGRSCKSSLAALCLLSVESSFGSFNCSRSGELFCRCDSMSRRAGGDNLRLCHRFESRLQRVSSCRWSLFCFSSEKRGSRCSSAPHRKRCGHKVSAVNYRNVR